jgi:hypothetical protein
MLIGPWALTTAGKPSAAAPVAVAATAAPVRNRRRDVSFVSWTMLIYVPPRLR